MPIGTDLIKPLYWGGCGGKIAYLAADCLPSFRFAVNPCSAKYYALEFVFKSRLLIIRLPRTHRRFRLGAGAVEQGALFGHAGVIALA